MPFGPKSNKALLLNPSFPARSLLGPLGVISQDGGQHLRDRPGGQVVAVLVLQGSGTRPGILLLLSPPVAASLQPPLPLVLRFLALLCLGVAIS